MYERKIKRYSAYFLGWCQAFGEHDISFEDDRDMNWLFGESKIGIVFSAKTRRLFLKEMLREHQEGPLVILSETSMRIGDLHYPFVSEQDRKGVAGVVKFFKNNDEIHMFLTSHFCYPPGTRIITFSIKKPLIILYKELAPLTVRIVGF